jgi:hypothetical protein
MQKQDPTRSQPSTLARGMTGWAIAGNFAFGVAGMVMIGYALERWIWPQYSPKIIVGCAIAGIVAGGYRFIRDGLAANRSFSARGETPKR